MLTIAVGVLSLAASPGVRAAAEDVDSTGITWLVEQEIARGDIPGAVVLIGDRDRVFYQRAFGYRALSPRPEPMRRARIPELLRQAGSRSSLPS